MARLAAPGANRESVRLALCASRHCHGHRPLVRKGQFRRVYATLVEADGAQVIHELAGDVEGQAVVAKMNVDANSAVPASLGIRSIPTLMVFKNGEMVERLVGGNIPKSVLAETLLKHA